MTRLHQSVQFLHFLGPKPSSSYLIFDNYTEWNLWSFSSFVYIIKHSVALEFSVLESPQFLAIFQKSSALFSFPIQLHCNLMIRRVRSIKYARLSSVTCVTSYFDKFFICSICNIPNFQQMIIKWTWCQL